MNALKVSVLLTASLLPILSSADVPATEPMTIPTSAEALMHDPKASDGKVIEVRGYYLPDLMKVPHLYASRKDALDDKEFDSIDLIFLDDSLAASLAGTEPACLVLKGSFNTYDHGHVLIGLTSKYGVLYVQEAERCSGG